MMNAITNLAIYIVGTFISVLVYNICYAKINNHRIKFCLINILIIILETILVMFNNIIHHMSIKNILNFFTLTFGMKIEFKDDYKKVAINYVFLYLMIILIEITLTNAAYYIGLFHNSSSANSLTYSTILLSLAIGIVQYTLIAVPFIKRFIQNIIYYFYKSNTIKATIILIFLTVDMIATLNIENFGNENSIKLIIILLAIFIYLFTDIVRLRYHEEILTNSNHKLIEYNSKYAKFLDEYKIYKHNINHKLSGMKAFGNKKINALIDDLLNKETTFSVRNNNIYNVPNGIKGIVAEKLYNKDYDSMIHNKIKTDYFSKLSPQAFNSISECLGIALDNAIEACEETENPVITMDIYENKDNVCIKIGNTFKNCIDIDRIGNKYYSTKNRGSGLGLFSIKKNKLVKEKITIINDIYYIDLQIKKAR